MSEHVIIDGNNLLFAMRTHAPIPLVGRETMVKVIERWARRGSDEVTLVLDGAPPREGLTRQMASSRIRVVFSAPKSADDLIVEMIARAPDPHSVRVVTGDTAIRHDARARRCQHSDAVGFIDELFPTPERAAIRPTEPSPEVEKPDRVEPGETDRWLKLFGVSDDDPTDSSGGMI